MTWHHGIPDSSVVFLLLLLFSAASEPNKDCIFQQPPLQTTSFSDEIDELKKYLLFDYPVFVPSNLKPDEFCLGLWKLHLIDRNLNSMIKVSGSSLKKYIENIKLHTKFIKDCKIDDTCVDFERANISQFLQPIPSFLKSLADWMEKLIQNRLAGDFHNCTVIQCLPDSYAAPAISHSVQKHEMNHSSQPVYPGRSYWGLLILPVFLLCTLSVLRLPCRRCQNRIFRCKVDEMGTSCSHVVQSTTFSAPSFLPGRLKLQITKVTFWKSWDGGEREIAECRQRSHGLPF